MSTHKASLDELVYYPPHDPRTASAEYRRVHDHLVHELDSPCWICGVRNSDVVRWPADVRRHFQLETHHTEIEWAAANGVDLAYVIRDFPSIHDHDQLVEWIDSEHNMLVLCAAHHRGHFTGIHSVSYPVWKLQRLQGSAFAFIPQLPWPAPPPAIAAAAA